MRYSLEWLKRKSQDEALIRMWNNCHSHTARGAGSWFQYFGKPAVIYESETYGPCEKTGTPAIPLLGTSPAEMCAKFTKNTCTRIFMAALNVTLPKQKAKYPSIVVWVFHFLICMLVTQACWLGENPLNCTFIISVFFCMYVILQCEGFKNRWMNASSLNSLGIYSHLLLSETNGKEVHQQATNRTLDLECFRFTSIHAFKTVTPIIFSVNK